MQPVTTIVTPINMDLRLGETSSKANSWTTGLTRISPMPVSQYGMKVNQADICDMGTPAGAHCETNNERPSDSKQLVLASWLPGAKGHSTKSRVLRICSMAIPAAQPKIVKKRPH